MSINERIVSLIDSKFKGRQVDFCRAVGISQSSINSIIGKRGSAPSCDTISKICSALDVDANWLLNGVSNTSDTPSCSELVPVLDAAAFAGIVCGDNPSSDLSRCERIPVLRDSDDVFALRIHGDSMTPDFSEGSIIVVKEIHNDWAIPYGHVLLLSTRDGAFLKRITLSDDKSTFLCASINPRYATMAVPVEEALAIYKILFQIKEYD